MSESNNEDVLVKVENVGKIFCRDFKKSLWYGLKDSASDLVSWGKKSPPVSVSQPSGNSDSKQLRPSEFWANQNVSFELRRGECLGLIGRNGAGKTTLLKMLNGLIKPDVGSIEMRGRIGALIALGSGFNPILTGRENIYVNGTVLGLTTQEITAKFDEIIDFAEIGEFIDSPVQTYSSGMQVRLGFAIATTLQPDVLILDEVLAVGDASFRHKCYHRLNKMLSNAAVILVSHSMDYIAATCSRVAMLQHGIIRMFDDVNEGISFYNEANAQSDTQWLDGGQVKAIYPPILEADVRLENTNVTYGGSLCIEIEIVSEANLQDVIFCFSAVNLNEQMVMAWHSSLRPEQIDLRPGRQIFRIRIDPLLLHDGKYRWNFVAAKKGSIEHCIWMARAGGFEVTSNHRPIGDIPYLVETNKFECVKVTAETPVAQ